MSFSLNADDLPTVHMYKFAEPSWNNDRNSGFIMNDDMIMIPLYPQYIRIMDA